MEYDDDVSRELIKCVVVGDTAVGKTRLICAKACGQRFSLEQLMTVHVPTVWAIDQYRISKEVLEKSFDHVDEINVSMRLWDTFGDHNNDRCFAYGRSDVVLLCFSVASPRSLEHARSIWYPEIRRMCPNVPVLLVACKVDLRHLCLQTEFQQLLAKRRPSPLKPIRPDHIVLPEQGRAIAKEIGAFYYETSVFNHFGIDDVYVNAIRAALCRRRQARLWLGSSFQSVKYPQIQTPFQPPKPDQPTIRILQSHFVNDLALSFEPDNPNFADCVIHVKDKSYFCHRLILSAASKFFHNLFVCTTSHCHTCPAVKNRSSIADEDSLNHNFVNNNNQVIEQKTNSKPMREIEFDLLRCHSLNNSCHSNRSSVGSNSRQQNNNKKTVVDNGNTNYSKIRLSSTDSVHSTHSLHRKLPYVSEHARNLNSLQNYPDHVTDLKIENDIVNIIFDDKKLKSEAVLTCLHYIYFGDLPTNYDFAQNDKNDKSDVATAAEIFQLKHMIVRLSSIRSFGCEFTEFSSEANKKEFLSERNSLLTELGFELSLFSDVEFVMDSCSMPAHKFLLSARSEVMKAMFSNKFRESCTSQVELPGVIPEVLFMFLNYVYFDSLNISFRLTVCDYIEALELANRMCLLRFTNLLENDVILFVEDSPTDEKTEEILHILEPAQIYNAKQLSSWCLNYLCCNYKILSDHHGKLLKTLSPSNQDYITAHRWPPLWFVKEMEFYDKTLREGQKNAEVVASKLLKRNQTGCLCFASRTSKRYQHNSI